MLNMIEMSDMWQFKNSLPDGREKELLNRVLFDYSRYMDCGTPEECRDRLEWMQMSPEDIRQKFTYLAKHTKDEIEYIREEADRKAEAKYKPTPKRRGRKPKEEKETECT